MASGSDVLDMLLPNGGWIITGDEYENIVWVDDRAKCTKTKFEAGFNEYDAWKTQQDSAKIAAKTAAQAKLAALGLTVEDLQALGL